MMEWTILYRALGISDDSASPTPYELLNIDPESCNADMVDEQLKKQKIKLRQNIPSQQFIPLILMFEKTKLDKAASILRDPDAKHKFDIYLRKQKEKKKRQEHLVEKKRKIRKAIRLLVESMLNPDKTLDDNKRPDLERKLAKFKLKPDVIKKLADNIPSPAQQDTALDEKVIDYYTLSVELIIEGRAITPQIRERVLAFASKLNIPTPVAVDILAEKIKEQNDQMDADNLEIELLDDAETSWAQSPVTDFQYADEEWDSTRLMGLMKIIIPASLAAVIVIGLSIWLFVLREKPESIFEGPKLYTVDTNEPEEGHQPEEQNDTDLIAQGEPAVESLVDPNILKEETSPEPSPVLAKKLITPEIMKDTFYKGERPEELLTDIASLSLLCQARLLQYRAGLTWEESELESRVKQTTNEKKKWYTEKLNILPLTSIKTEYKGKTDTIDWKDCSAEELLEMNSPEAVEEVFRRFEEVRIKHNPKPPDVRRGAVYLYVLERMTSQTIPEKLVNQIANSGPVFAHLIVDALVAAHEKIEGYTEHRLPLMSTQEERDECALWWKQNIPEWGKQRSKYMLQIQKRMQLESSVTTLKNFRFTPRIRYYIWISPHVQEINPQSKTPTSDRDSIKALPAWLTHAESLKLLYVILEYAKQSVTMLAHDSNDTSTLEMNKNDLYKQPEEHFDAADVGGKLIDTYDKIYNSLKKHIEQNDPNQNQSTGAIDRKRWAYLGTCDTDLQKLLVYSEAIGELYFLLAQQKCSDANVQEKLSNYKKQYEEDRNSAGDVLSQYRESTYYQLKLLHEIVDNCCEASDEISENPNSNTLTNRRTR